MNVRQEIIRFGAIASMYAALVVLALVLLEGCYRSMASLGGECDSSIPKGCCTCFVLGECGEADELRASCIPDDEDGGIVDGGDAGGGATQ